MGMYGWRYQNTRKKEMEQQSRVCGIFEEPHFYPDECWEASLQNEKKQN
jgi:hypothetical protein